MPISAIKAVRCGSFWVAMAMIGAPMKTPSA